MPRRVPTAALFSPDRPTVPGLILLEGKTLHAKHSSMVQLRIRSRMKMRLYLNTIWDIGADTHLRCAFRCSLTSDTLLHRTSVIFDHFLLQKKMRSLDPRMFHAVRSCDTAEIGFQPHSIIPPTVGISVTVPPGMKAQPHQNTSPPVLHKHLSSHLL